MRTHIPNSVTTLQDRRLFDRYYRVHTSIQQQPSSLEKRRAGKRRHLHWLTYVTTTRTMELASAARCQTSKAKPCVEKCKSLLGRLLNVQLTVDVYRMKGTKFKSDRSMNTFRDSTAVALSWCIWPFSCPSYFLYVPYQHSIAVVIVEIIVVIVES